MKKLIKYNSHFFIFCFLFFLIGAIILLLTQKPAVITFFSERRTSFWNLFFSYFTQLGEVPMYIIFLVLFLFVKFRFSILIAITGISVAVVSFTTKLFFAVDRPLMFLEKNKLDEMFNFIEGVQLNIGPTSFPSGHTMSAFAMYGIIAFLLGGKKIWGIPLFVIALLVGISRVYLVQHFFVDVYFGALLGVLLAVLIFLIQQKYFQSESHWTNQSLLRRKNNFKQAKK